MDLLEDLPAFLINYSGLLPVVNIEAFLLKETVLRSDRCGGHKQVFLFLEKLKLFNCFFLFIFFHLRCVGRVRT